MGGGCCDLQERAAWWWSLLDVAETRSSRGSDAREMLAGLSERSRTKSAPTPSLNSERASLKRQRHNVSLDSFWNTRWLGKSELQLVFILLFFFLLAVHDVLSCFVFLFLSFFFIPVPQPTRVLVSRLWQRSGFTVRRMPRCATKTPLHAVVVSAR